MRIRYSEIFFSFQGEGLHAGRPAAWLRFFGCNLNCNGFGQKNPLDPSTWVLPYKDYDPSGVTDVKNLPVWQYGCDSSYSWSHKYKHLAKDATPEEIAERLESQLLSVSNPQGKFVHPITNQKYMLCFTGGEPMLQQKAIIAIMRALEARNNLPHMVTVETNGTQVLSEDLADYIDDYVLNSVSCRWHWAISPKLASVSGELAAIKPEVLVSYYRVGDPAILKFVCNGTKQCWDELEDAVASIRAEGGPYMPDVWVMPVGATVESQSETTVGDIALEAMRRGYNVATRNHVYVFGNAIGR
jgi:7-carboxy-7-deazaguanine synthase